MSDPYGDPGDHGAARTPPPGSYAGPPPTVAPDATGQGSGYHPPYPPAGYAQPRYPQPGYPQPGYPPGGLTYGGYPYGYAPPGYGMGPLPGYLRDRRPGTLTAAAVLGYVNAGLLILAAILLFDGASIFNDFDDQSGYSGVSTELTIDAVFNLLAAGLLIGGAVALTNRSASGRLVYCVGGAIVLAEAVYWLTRWDDIRFLGLVFYAAVYAALAIIGLSLAWVSGATAWLNTPAADVPAA